MKVIAYDTFRPGVTMETITPLLPEETAHAWRLWKQGIIRENYTLADRPGVVIVFEVADAAEAQLYLNDFPMTRAGYLEWVCLPLAAPFVLEAMFNDEALRRVAIPAADGAGS